MAQKTLNKYFFIRILLGGVFLVSGGEKLLTPYQNFLYSIESYEVFPPVLAQLTAHVFPWAELFMGAFLVLGLWLNLTSKLVWWMFVAFLALLSQAVFRDLPIKECGCFGGLWVMPLPMTILLDSALLIFTSFLRTRQLQALVLSLDRYYDLKEKKH